MDAISSFGILVAALTLLTTVLIGWQIYTTIYIEKRIRNISKNHAAEARKEVDDKISKLSISLQLNLFVINCNLAKYDTAIPHILSLILSAQSAESKTNFAAFAVETLKDKNVTLSSVGKEVCRSMADLTTSTGTNISELKKIIEASIVQ